MYSMYINDILMPVTPGSISLKIGNNNKTVTLINEGEVNLIKTPGLTEITIDELLLPAVRYPFAHYGSVKSVQDILYHERINKTFHRPQYYLTKLEAWKKQKKPIKFKLIRTTPNFKKLLWDTKFDCTIEDYEIMEDADKYGMDVCVKLSLKEYRYWGAKKLVLKKKTGTNGVVGHAKKSRHAKDTARSYTTKKGDTLKKIAKRQLNDARKAKKIYTLNKKVIEAAAKKHGRKSSSSGHYLYKGTKLKLPR